MNDKKINIVLAYVFAALLPLALLIYLKYPILGSTLRGTSYGCFNGAIHGKMVRMADENALAGMQNKADGEKVRALVRYLIALTLLPKDEITEPRHRAYRNGFSLTTRSF